MAVRVEALDVYGRGLARDEGRVVFIEGALPDEVVDYRLIKAQKRFAEARVTAVHSPSPQRVAPLCAHYADCGGCALQHLSFEGQLQAKQQLFQSQLQRIGRVLPQQMLAPIAGQAWRYRARSRLALHYRGDTPQLGYYARGSHAMVEVEDCLVLDEALAAALPAVRDLLRALLPQRIKALSLHRGEAACALHLESDTPVPIAPLRAWQAAQPGNWTLWVNNDCVLGEAEALYYELPEEGLRIAFTPRDFTQVNPQVNRTLVAQAMAWLKPEGDEAEAAADFFAGLGNFALPMAARGHDVQAVEGVAEMVARMQVLAEANGLSARLKARRGDLFAPSAKVLRQWQQQPLWLLDPPRAGAAELLRGIGKQGRLRRIVYVSCDSATLARDAQILAEKGFRAKAARVANMFAQTAHVESITVFDREE